MNRLHRYIQCDYICNAKLIKYLKRQEKEAQKKKIFTQEEQQHPCQKEKERIATGQVITVKQENAILIRIINNRRVRIICT